MTTTIERPSTTPAGAPPETEAREPIAIAGVPAQPPTRRNRFAQIAASAPAVPARLSATGWAGVIGIAISLVLLGFLAHASVISGLQYQRAQQIAHDTLRTSLAKAETPVGQLDFNGDPVVPGTPVAQLQIPAIGVDQTVVEGTSADTLRQGPGHRRDTVMPGQAGTSVLMGRQATYGGPFAQLRKLKPGDEITVITGQAANTFRVVSVRSGGEDGPAPLASGQGRLQLITGAGLAFAPSGTLIVDADLVSAVQDASSRVLASAMLPDAEQAMGRDPGAWWAAAAMIVFSLQAAVAVWWAWRRWGRRSAWLVGLPVLVFFLLFTSDRVLNAMPNVL